MSTPLPSHFQSSGILNRVPQCALLGFPSSQSFTSSGTLSSRVACLSTAVPQVWALPCVSAFPSGTGSRHGSIWTISCHFQQIPRDEAVVCARSAQRKTDTVLPGDRCIGRPDEIASLACCLEIFQAPECAKHEGGEPRRAARWRRSLL